MRLFAALLACLALALPARAVPNRIYGNLNKFTIQSDSGTLAFQNDVSTYQIVGTSSSLVMSTSPAGGEFLKVSTGSGAELWLMFNSTATKNLSVIGDLRATRIFGEGSGISSTTPSGPAGGDLSGYYPNPSFSSARQVEIATLGLSTYTLSISTHYLRVDLDIVDSDLNQEISDRNTGNLNLAISTHDLGIRLDNEISSRRTYGYEQLSISTEAIDSRVDDLYQSKLSTSGGRLSGSLEILSSTLTVGGQDPSGYSVKTSSGITLGGCVRYSDGSQQCSASSGHVISTAVAGVVQDLPTERKLIFDGNQFVLTDSGTLQGTLVQNPSVCQSVAREVPSGTVDGTNDTFYLTREPKIGSEYVFVNGIQQNSGYDYTITESTITFTAFSIPQTGWFVNVNYCYPTSEPDLNWSPPMNIDGSQIIDSSINVLQLVEALKRPVQSTAGGDYKRVTAIEYNPATGDLRITYEE